MNREWETWASARRWRYFPVWDAMRFVFRGGGLAGDGVRYLTCGWSGSFGGMPCFGFVSGPGGRLGRLQVVAVSVPNTRFPHLSIAEANFALRGMGMSIEPEFDLHWEVNTADQRFAFDLLTEPMRRELMGMVPDFYQLWFEHDSILISSLIELEPESIDRYLFFLRRLVDLIPPEVLARATVPTRQSALSLVAAPTPPHPVVRPIAAPSDPWKVWAQERGWLHAPNAKQLVERYHHAPLPTSDGARFTDGFVGKFGELPCFGWRSTVDAEGGPRVRHALCVRRPGLDLKPVRITLEDQLLAELIGSNDIEIGDPTFDARWRVTADDEDFARRLLTPDVWKVFMDPDVPKFGQLWFERDVVAVVTEGPIGPGDVDPFLRFLHRTLTATNVA